PWDQRHVVLAVRAKVRDGRTGGVVGERDAKSRGQCVATKAGALVAAKAHVASRGVAVGQWRAEQGPVARQRHVRGKAILQSAKRIGREADGGQEISQLAQFSGRKRRRRREEIREG